nr:MAG TPA: hypothetical protein [Caudoviricetes sp.]
MQDTYTKAELVERFKAMKRQEIDLANDYMKEERDAGAAWHRARVSLLKELIALTEAGAL